ncbi:phage major capsid protein [Sphingomonas sp. TREG-RG-20F-R18-01]|uniref:phage major capsid protein n=1 Tax=Sphingomonas sp. TREG-RG-20F-R18-01 TaxID=2914982 RepID=UPI001F59A775|nr:phage major capsid protein [Sphingomonas sp. TREG-RG-20F-R18-01]
MKMFSMSALAAAAAVCAMPFRTKAAPTLTLAAPTIPPMPRAIVGATVRAEAATDPKAMIAALNGAFEEFKKTHAQEVSDIKAGKTDVVTTDKMAKINETLNDLQAAIDTQAKQIAAGNLHGNGGREISDPGYTTLFGSFMRDGTREQEEKLKSESKVGVRAAMSEGSGTDGGYTAPIEWDRTVTERLKLISPIRAEATVQSISKAGFIKLFTDRTIGSGWVGETASRAATATPQFTALPFTPGEIYANAAASQDLLDDSEVNMETWLPGQIELEFSRQEGIAFVAGDGVNKPFGVLSYVTGGSAAARHPWGDIKTHGVKTAGQIDADSVSQIIYDLPAMYQPNAKFFMNRQTMSAVRLLKDSTGRYYWQPTYQVGQPSTLLGAPIVDVPDMPNIGAAAVPMLFGDMREAYLVIDRIGFRVLRDPYTNKPYIAFYCTKRVGGGVKNPDALKALQL